MEHVHQKEEIQLSMGQQHIICAADGVTAVDQNQLLHPALHTGLDHRFSKAAQIRVAYFVTPFKVFRHMIQDLAGSAQCIQQLHRGVFADIPCGAHTFSPFSARSISTKASMRVASWPSPP